MSGAWHRHRFAKTCVRPRLGHGISIRPHV
ncbi:hypothetical protein F383_06122 [Gossypium arboreum]|uniref:Uncharacterized protein n=1 Tax=Gossypium arboreum TaxID=29729 RepID=A0A0B0P445_GOSAR|nr:hypothetical protein F383_06122 [Gossypium arboreum]